MSLQDAHDDAPNYTQVTLTEEERSAFAVNGWIGPFPLLSEDEVEALCSTYNDSKHLFRPEAETSASTAPDAFDELPWFKSLHARLPLFATVAAHPAIVGRLLPLLGPDVMLWGSSVTVRKPGQVHRWHVDVEHRAWRGITAFVGLQNTSHDSTLKVINRTHRLDTMPQELRVRSDADAVAAAQRLGIHDAVIVEVDLRPGEFFLFDGPLWHGSLNRGTTTRMALLTQYARTDAPVAIPLSWDQPIRWHPTRPPCLVVS